MAMKMVFILYVCCVHVGQCVWALMYSMCGVREQLSGSRLFSSHHVGTEDKTQIIRFDSRHLSPAQEWLSSCENTMEKCAVVFLTRK